MKPEPMQPMPNITPALLKIEDARAAIERASKSWNKSQLVDAIRSVRYFLDIASDSLEGKIGVDK